MKSRVPPSQIWASPMSWVAHTWAMKLYIVAAATWNGAAIPCAVMFAAKFLAAGETYFNPAIAAIGALVGAAIGIFAAEACIYFHKSECGELCVKAKTVRKEAKQSI